MASQDASWANIASEIMGEPIVESKEVPQGSPPSQPEPPMPDIRDVEVDEDFVASLIGESVNPATEEDDPILEIKVSMKRKSGRKQEMHLSDEDIAKYRQKMRNKNLADKQSDSTGKTSYPKKGKWQTKKVTKRSDPSHLYKDKQKTDSYPEPDADVKTYARQTPKKGQDVGKKPVKEMATTVGSIGVNMAPKKKKRGLKDAMNLASQLQKEKK